MEPIVKKTPEEIELEWMRNVYQGDNMKQLTVRAVVMGTFLGGFMSLSNLYVGLKTGWGLGVAITSCVLSYSIWSVLHKLFPRLTKSKMSILENNCMQSTASAAGYSTGGTMVSAVSAYILVTGTRIDNTTLFLWTIFLAALGVFLAIPMKRQMVNIEQLKFPSGIAAAETLRGLHSEGREGVRKAKSLGIGGLLGAVVCWFRDATASWMPFNIPSLFELPKSFTLAGAPLVKFTWAFEGSLIMIAAGAIMGIRVAWSMLLGAFINYGIVTPQMYEMGVIKQLGFRGIVTWSVWGGVAVMVTSSLLNFALSGRTVLRAFSGVTALFTRNKYLDAKRGITRAIDPLARIEVPGSWFMWGTLIAGGGTVALLKISFGTPVLLGIIAVVLSFFLAIVACRATGETDTTPVGALGKITQLTYGVLAPTNMTTNLMTASVTANVAGSSADLLTDLKSGYLLGANARKQFIAQFLGIFGGTLVVVPVFNLLVPDASVLGSDKFPAPSAQVWAAVAKMLSAGLHSLDVTARWAMLIGGIVGILITLLEVRFPKYKKFIPSPMGLGLAMVIPAWNSISFFIGALIAYVIEKKRPQIAEMYTITVSSGIIAGESLIGVLIAILSVTGVI